MKGDEVTTLTKQKPGAPRGAANDQELYDAINRLPERDRALLHLLYWDGLTLREAAHREGVSFQALHTRHLRIIRDLRRQLSMPEPEALEEPSQWEAQVDQIAASRAAGSKGRWRSRTKEYPPFPGWVAGKSWPNSRGWGAPTWTCGRCLAVLEIEVRRCSC